MRDAFIAATNGLLDEDPRTALVLADISAAAFARAAAAHPDRVVNVGIREQLMIGVAGGLALTGLRPIVHTYAPFLVERAFEQIKLDLDHQGVGAALVSVGASYDHPPYGRTHQSPGDVALLDTLPGWTVHVPGHPDEVVPLLRAAASHDDPVYLRLSSRQNTRPYAGGGRVVPLRRGRRAVVIAVGPMLDPVLAATKDLDVSVGYTHTPRPFDAAGLRGLIRETEPAVILVEPYLAGTSAHEVSAAFGPAPHRLLSLGVGRQDLHRYGTTEDHDRAHGLDPASLRQHVARFAGLPD